MRTAWRPGSACSRPCLAGGRNPGFLTRDNVLLPYAAAGRDQPEDPPFAVSVSAWAHIVRSLCPRTEDYEQTLVDLLDTPSVRPRGVVTHATVTEILGRINMLVEDSMEEIATRIMLDSALLKEVEGRDEIARRGLRRSPLMLANTATGCFRTPQ